MVWNVIAAVASVLAVFAALATVRLTINYRREERLRHLAEALTFVVTTAEDHPGPNGPAPEVAMADARLEEALRQLDRVVALSLLGLSPQISTPVLELMDPSMRDDPRGAFMYGTQAFQQLLEEHRPRKPLRARWRDWRALRRVGTEKQAGAEKTKADEHADR
jgi:hypothetical protein